MRRFVTEFYCMSRTESHLTVSQIKGKNVLSECQFSYPQRLAQQEGWLPHVSVIACGFGGGYVEGDDVTTNIRIEEGSRACYRSQGYTKVFKSLSSRACIERFRMELKDDSFFIFIPEPVMCFAKAIFHQSYSIRMTKDASLVFVDWATCGRMGKKQSENEFWAMSLVKKTTEVFRGDSALFVERQAMAESSINGLTIADRLGRCGVVGSVLIVGKKTQAVRKRLAALQHRQSFREVREGGPVIVGSSSGESASSGLVKRGVMSSVSTLDDQSSLVRFTADTVDQGYLFLSELLRPLEVEMDGLVPYADKLYDVGERVATNGACPIRMLRKFDLADQSE